ncbi:unnamed protein product, partial [Meganyctiphanes norvegica]
MKELAKVNSLMSDLSQQAQYGLRTKSIIKRIESEKKRENIKRKAPRQKQKPPPLSKYRRKTANARERNRMRDINSGFVTLLHTIPNLPEVDTNKLTKITILRLAVNYITSLAKVLEDSENTHTDVEDVKELWCLENAHMIKEEHLMKPIIRPTKSVSGQKSTDKKSKSTSSKNDKTQTKINNNLKNIQRCNIGKTNPVVTEKKNPSKSKSKSKVKVCKTASVATNNGAYITMKNLTAQTSQRLKGQVVNMEPIMLNMRVKRPRLETFISPIPAKMLKLGHTMSLNQPLLTLLPYGTNVTTVHNVVPKLESFEPLHGTTPISIKKTNELRIPCATPSVAILPVKTEYPPECKDTVPTLLPMDFEPSSVFQELDSPVVRNDVPLYDFTPFRSGRRFSDSSTHDSAFSSGGESTPPSPLTNTSFSIPQPALVPLGESSPYSSISSLTSSNDYSYFHSDSESDLNASVEFGNLFGDEAFEDELDHLTSTLAAEGDDALSLFLGQSSTHFLCNAIDDCV